VRAGRAALLALALGACGEAGGPAAGDRQMSGALSERAHGPVGEKGDLREAGDRRHERPRAGREHDPPGADQVAAGGKRAGILVVDDQPFDMVVERVKPCGGNHTRLAHGTAEPGLPDPGLRNEIPRTAQYASDRATESFRQIEPSAVEV